MTDEELRQLQEEAHQLEELTRHPGWQVFTRLAQNGDGMVAANERRVLHGNCETTDEYQKWVGWLSGARTILGIPEATALKRDRESAKSGNTAAS